MKDHDLRADLPHHWRAPPGDLCCDGACGPKGACCDFDAGSCRETTQACCDASGDAYLGAGTKCQPGDLCRPACENCQTVQDDFFECGHFTPDPAEECSPAFCIHNELSTASCESFPYRAGPPDCRTFDTGIAGEVVQSLYDQPVPTACTPSSTGGYHLWKKIYSGCGTSCGERSYFVRCDTTPCTGNPISTRRLGTILSCSGCP